MMHLAVGTYSSAQMLVSARLVPSDMEYHVLNQTTQYEQYMFCAS